MSRKALLAELPRIRERGYVSSLDESEIGVSSVAAPLFDARSQVIGAVSVAGPSMRLSKARIPAVARLVMQAAGEISRDMGDPAWSASGIRAATR